MICIDCKENEQYSAELCESCYDQKITEIMGSRAEAAELFAQYDSALEEIKSLRAELKQLKKGPSAVLRADTGQVLREVSGPIAINQTTKPI